VSRIRYASDVAAPVDVAFAYVEDPDHVPEWMFAVTRFEPAGPVRTGIGAVYHATMRLGPLHHDFRAEVTEYRRNAVVGLTCRHGRHGLLGALRSGCTQVYRFDPLGIGRSVLTVEMDWVDHAGPVGRLADRLGAALAVRLARRTERALRESIEQYHGPDPLARSA
jgi:uncharacterized protein YndB with AHSA1/START domain